MTGLPDHVKTQYSPLILSLFISNNRHDDFQMRLYNIRVYSGYLEERLEANQLTGCTAPQTAGKGQGEAVLALVEYLAAKARYTAHTPKSVKQK